jgi:hypothetical protein
MNGTLAVWKYRLAPGENTLLMPKNAEILSVEVVSESAYLYALCCTDSGREYESRLFAVVPTGSTLNFPNGSYPSYMGTFQGKGFIGETLVFHVFERMVPNTRG